MVDADSQHPLQLSAPGDQQPVQQTSAKLRFAGFVPWQRRPVSGDEQLAGSVTPSAIVDNSDIS